VTATDPGQSLRLSFRPYPGDHIQVAIGQRTRTDAACCPAADVTLIAPDGARLFEGTLVRRALPPPIAAAKAGTYTILVHPDSDALLRIAVRVSSRHAPNGRGRASPGAH
jgi:hypothetical protein